MKKLVLLIGALVLVVSCPAQAWYTIVSDITTVGTYDEQVAQTNAVEREAVGNGKTLAQFKLDIAAAYAANTGGVCTFDIVQGYEDGVFTNPKRPGLSPDGGGRGRNWLPDPNQDGLPVALWYGASQAQSVSITFEECGEIWPRLIYTSVGIATSGPAYGVGGEVWDSGGLLTPETNYWSTDNTDEAIAFSAGLAELAVTLISKDSAYNVDVWVDYADATSSIVRTISVAAGAGTDDVFVHFAAGSSPITGFHWDSDVSRPPIDDLAFIVVPEPASLGLLTLGGLALLRRRRG